MKDIIIEHPHLQSLGQKLASAFLAGCSWLLWLYFLLPLFTLGGWLLGAKSLSDEIRWFGGYKTLLQLLQLYGEIVLAIAVLWLVWSLFLSWLHRGKKTAGVAPVSDPELATHFGLDTAELAQAKSWQTATVHFDDHAGIVDIATP